jgi:uncharacterized protein (DUF433 family)
MSLLDRIIIDPEICHGKPSIRGLRYPVETILELLSSGMTTEEILTGYEDLEREDILAALEFALKRAIISRSPDVMGGAPVFAGTRVPVQTVLDYLEAGDHSTIFSKVSPRFLASR